MTGRPTNVGRAFASNGDGSYQRTTTTVREEKCPQCPATRTYYQSDDATKTVIAIGCNNCGWRKAVSA